MRHAKLRAIFWLEISSLLGAYPVSSRMLPSVFPPYAIARCTIMMTMIPFQFFWSVYADPSTRGRILLRSLEAVLFLFHVQCWTQIQKFLGITAHIARKKTMLVSVSVTNDVDPPIPNSVDHPPSNS
ncbi:hypothetical protein K435DRAFT_387233 [Dendrothele bispora CBS 962.96]|uniref:Uncharacterized protein n=1 Tax=Dendrothele bispora (strain CBS 962.96) TaxID=1314807 RepID=A0A4S8L9S7_DENBC|nr:hypothetical protein K435DRAFT_387233 [Dendrothele bispora CBS 962.96]